MVENKEKIVQMLLPVLQETQDLHNLKKLHYSCENNREYVIAEFENGHQKIIHFIDGSGLELIRQITFEANYAQ